MLRFCQILRLSQPFLTCLPSTRSYPTYCYRMINLIYRCCLGNWQAFCCYVSRMPAILQMTVHWQGAWSCLRRLPAARVQGKEGGTSVAVSARVLRSKTGSFAIRNKHTERSNRHEKKKYRYQLFSAFCNDRRLCRLCIYAHPRKCR